MTRLISPCLLVVVACNSNVPPDRAMGDDCPAGFVPRADQCVDVDECADDLADCDTHATCTNTEGGFACECDSGYHGDGTTCSANSDCLEAEECSANADCLDLAFGRACVCKAGYEGNGSVCEDVDECVEHDDNCDSNATCINTDGSFDCSCNDGYRGDGVTCILDEPEPVNECSDGTHDCDANATCTDLEDGFECDCKLGYVGDGFTCELDDECLADVDDCHADAACTNTDTGFSCRCNSGFVGDGILCCDGSAGVDATACLQSAIDALHARGGGTLQLPDDGMFSISEQLVLREGVSVDGTTGVVDLSNNDNDTRATIYSNDAIDFIRVSGSNAGLRDLKLSRPYDNGAGSTSGIMVSIAAGSQHLVFDRVTLWGPRISVGYSMDAANIADVAITNGVIRGARFSILTNTTNYSWSEVESWGAHTRDLLIENNRIYTRGDGVNINSPVWNGLRPDDADHTCTYPGRDRASGNPNVGAHDIVIRNNLVAGNYIDETKSGRGFCIALAGAKHVIVEGNELVDCKWQALHVEDRCYNLMVVDNDMDNIIGPQPFDESAWSSSRGSVWFQSSRGVALVNNRMRAAYDTGVYVLGNMAPKWTCHDTETGFNRLFRISGNEVIAPGEHGYRISGTGDDASGIRTCFGKIGGACDEPEWGTLWSNNYVDLTHSANGYTAGPDSLGACSPDPGVVGLTMGTVEAAFCP